MRILGAPQSLYVKELAVLQLENIRVSGKASTLLDPNNNDFVKTISDNRQGDSSQKLSIYCVIKRIMEWLMNCRGAVPGFRCSVALTVHRVFSRDSGNGQRQQEEAHPINHERVFF